MAKATFNIEAANAKLQYLRGAFSQRNADFVQRDAIMEMEHDKAFWPNEAERPQDALRDRILMTSLPVKAINTIVGMFTQNPLRFVVRPDRKRPSEVQLARTGRIESFLQGVWQENERRYKNIRSRHVRSGSARGWGVYKVVWNPEREGEPDDDGASCGTPIELKPVDASGLFCEAGGVVEEWQSAMYVTYKRRVEIERYWGKAVTIAGEDDRVRGGEHDNSDDPIAEVDYWWWSYGPFTYHGKRRKGWHLMQCVYAGDTLLKKPTPMPGYTCIPYITWLTQTGYKTEPEFWGQGHLDAAKEAIANTDRAVSRWYRMLTFSAEGGGWLQQVKDDADNWIGPEQVQLEPGLWKSLPRGWQATPGVQNFASQLAQALVEMFGREMQDILLPLAATGHLPAGGSDMAGVTLQGIIDQAATWLAPDVESYANCIASVCMLILDLCAYYSPVDALVVRRTRGRGRRMQIDHVELKGEDLVGFSVDVAVDTENAADKLRKAQLALQYSRSPDGSRILSMRTIRETLADVEDPDEEEYLLDLEEVWNSDEMKLARRALIAERMGIPRPTPEAAAPVAASLPGGPGAPVQPPVTPGPPGNPLPPGMLPGQAGMQPSGPMMGGPMPQGAPMGPMAGPPPGMVSPQELGGSPMPTPVLPGMVPPGVIPR
jgi:hypothetical protein